MPNKPNNFADTVRSEGLEVIARLARMPRRRAAKAIHIWCTAPDSTAPTGFASIARGREPFRHETICRRHRATFSQLLVICGDGLVALLWLLVRPPKPCAGFTATVELRKSQPSIPRFVRCCSASVSGLLLDLSWIWAKSQGLSGWLGKRKRCRIVRLPACFGCCCYMP